VLSAVSISERGTVATSRPFDAKKHEEEAELWEKLQRHGNLAAREALFAAYAPFAKTIARRLYAERGRPDVDRSDFDQLALEGLLQAMERFDPSRGVPFRAFASRRITGNVMDGVGHMTEVREQVSWSRRMRNDRIRSLEASNGDKGKQDPLEILTELALGLALGFMLEGSGLYVDTGSEGTCRVLQNQSTAYDSVAWRELTGAMSDELGGLEERERVILTQHYINGLAFEHLASLLAISKGRVSQLHRAALLKLRKRMSARGFIRMDR
jgi:RNA polymerase sigma factor for flagellar operon FliA